MKVIRQSTALERALSNLRKRGKSIGFVPTMGALHEGHLSIVRLAKKENDAVVVSIFVNPLQFGPKEDFKKYPRDLKKDLRMLSRVGADFVFTPSEKTFYARDFQTTVSVGLLGRLLCGKTRPTHFAGVCTVLLKFLDLVRPSVLYFGQKDYQQFVVVRQMMRDLDLPARLRMVPTLREPDGVAMSSRNALLTPQARREAPALSRALAKAAALVKKGENDARKLRQAMLAELKKSRLARVDYAEIVDAETLRSVVKLKKSKKFVAALAVFFSKVRLIDNHILKG